MGKDFVFREQRLRFQGTPPPPLRQVYSGTRLFCRFYSQVSAWVGLQALIFLNINPLGALGPPLLSYLICLDELDRGDQIAPQLLANNRYI